MPRSHPHRQQVGPICSPAPGTGGLLKSAAWRERRARHLADNPDCVVCGRPARHVDHVINIAAGGSLGGPLQSLCAEHHRQKTQVESKLGNKRAAARRRRNRGGV